MALDQQRNWDISMAENLERIQLNARRGRDTASTQLQDDGRSSTIVSVPWKGPPIYLPDEILTQILHSISRFDDAQQTLAACCLLSHQWYNVAVPYLYEHPRLYGKNFDPFARTICPSLNLHVRKSPLSSLVHVLDMGGLVHQGSRSMTARLLGRTKANLTSFRAPQASFAINCLPALARCSKLKALDLSLVSESPPLPQLLKSVSHLSVLESFKLPRSTGFGSYDGDAPIQWPLNLQAIVLSGGIDAWFLAGVATFPETLRSMTIEHCPLAKSNLVNNFILHSVRKLPLLNSFKISNMPRFSASALDDLLYILPNIRKLSISVDYISPAFFEGGSGRHFVLDETIQEHAALQEDIRHEKLHTLELTNSGNPNIEDKITPIDILIAIDNNTLPTLRVVRVAKSLHWRGGETMEDAEALSDALELRNTNDWQDRVGEYEAMPTDQWKTTKPAQAAGIWFFDG